MERNGPLHHAALWLAATLAAAVLYVGLCWVLDGLMRVPKIPTEQPPDIRLDDFDTGIYQGDGDQVLVIDGKEALRWRAGPEVRRKGDGWEICNAAETVCEDFPAFP